MKHILSTEKMYWNWMKVELKLYETWDDYFPHKAFLHCVTFLISNQLWIPCILLLIIFSDRPFAGLSGIGFLEDVFFGKKLQSTQQIATSSY